MKSTIPWLSYTSCISGSHVCLVEPYCTAEAWMRRQLDVVPDRE